MNVDIPLENKKFKDLNPTVFGYEYCESNHKFSGIREYYLIHYVVDGMGTFEVENKKYNIKKGEIFIIKPNQVTLYQADGEHPWHYIWIGFSGELAKRIELLKSPVMSFSSRLFLEMCECEDLENTKEEFLASKLFMMISLLFRNEKRANNYVKQAADYINTSYMKELYVQDIAKLLRLNSRYLSRIFKQKMGVSVQQYIISIRMEKAVNFLKHNYSVSQTANMVGYTDVFNFSKMFKKTYGISPKLMQ